MTQTIEPERCVADAPILLDLAETQLLSPLLGSNVNLVVTPFIMDDLDESCRQAVHTYIGKGLVLIAPATETDMNALLTEVGAASPMCGSDRLLCRIAKRMRLSLLTGCDCLTRQAERRGIRTRSITWVMDRLVSNGVMRPTIAIRKLQELQRISPWLNDKLCQERVSYWQALDRQEIPIAVNYYSV